MKVGFFLILFPSVPLSVIAYPQVEMNSCITNAVNAVMEKGLNATYEQVENYCDCALTKIIDEKRQIKQSLDFCNAQYIN